PPTPTVQGFWWTLRGTDAETSPFGAPRAASHGVGRQEELPDPTVPGSTSSATNLSMVVSAGPWSSEKAEMSILEINEKLRPQLAEKKQQFRNIKEKFLVTQVKQNKYSKIYRLTITKCKDLIKSMLRDELQFKGEKLAEQLKQAEELRQYKVLVHSQLREKLREGRDASCSLTQHLQALLTLDEPDKSQWRDRQEQLAEGCRLAQHLVHKLSSANGQGEDADVQVEEAEKVQDSEVQKAKEREVPEDLLEECAVTCSNSHVPCDSNQPHRNTKITFDEDKFNSPFIDSSSHDEWADAVHIIPGSLSFPCVSCLCLVLLCHPDWSIQVILLPQPPEPHLNLFAGHWCDEVKKEDQEATGPRLHLRTSTNCPTHPREMNAVPQLKMQKSPIFCSVVSDFLWLILYFFYFSGLSWELLEVVDPEEQHIGFSLDVDEIEKYQEGEEDQNPPCPRLNSVLVEVEEPGVLQDSLDRCYSTSSTYFELPDSFQHYRSAFYSFEEQHISLSLDMDNRFFTLTVIRLHLVFQMGVIFPH
uniref:Olduvai domain-containing protein n=1 Tax=Macaca nemestrina TaxID=9545 RepID=A0A2K6CID7_MACNE